MQLAQSPQTIFKDSVIFIGKMRVENRVWVKTFVGKNKLSI